MIGESGVTLFWAVIVPAIVAAIVALLVEYAAKPSLEVRKERVLRRARTVWDLRDALQALEDELDSLATWTRQEEVDLVALEREVDQVRQRARFVEELATRSDQLPPAIWAELQFAIGRHRSIFETAESVRRAQPDERLRLAQYRFVFRDAGANFAIPFAYLSTPRWRWRKRRKLVARAESRDRWRDEHIPDYDEDDAWLVDLAKSIVATKGAQGALELSDALDTPGDGWLAKIDEPLRHVIAFALLADSDPGEDRARFDLARLLRDSAPRP